MIDKPVKIIVQVVTADASARYRSIDYQKEFEIIYSGQEKK